MDWVLRDEIRRIVREGLRGVAPVAVAAVEWREATARHGIALELRYGLQTYAAQPFVITSVV